MRLFLFLLFLSPSAFSAYTEMVIEGVKQSNGVWTTAGVMDTQGFVRTTGAVTVSGVTRNLPVSMAADTVAAGSMLRGAARLAGPIALAATAYDVYEWVTTDDDANIDADNGDWVIIDESIATPGFYWKINNCASGFCDPQSYPAPDYTLGNCKKAYQGIFNITHVTLSSQTASKFIYSCYGSHSSLKVSDYTWTKYSCTNDTQTVNSCKPKPFATDSDFLKLSQPSIPLLISGWANIPSLTGQPIPIKSTHFTPFSDWMGDPYFKDGNWWRDRMDVSPCPTSTQPTRVCIDIGPQKFEGATDPQTIPSQATGTATGTTPKEKPSFCKENPQSIACAELGELDDEELESEERPFQITPKSPWGSDNSNCPAPRVIHLSSGSVVEITYQPTCDFLAGVRPAVLALAFLAALYIALGIPVGKGD